MQRARIAIIGGGLAGAATAWALSRRGESDLLILEKEEFAGTHSSGRNAAMIRQLVEEPGAGSLARASAQIFRNPPPELEEHVHFGQVGSLLIGKTRDLHKLCERTSAQAREVLGLQWRAREEAVGQVPALAGASFESALWTQTDGVIDPAALLQGYLRAARQSGARLICDCEVRAIKELPGRRFSLQTSVCPIEAEIIVNAAGAWARSLALQAGAEDIALKPRCRHLFVSQPLEWVSPDWPFVWDISQELYFRAESGGLLMCAGDAADMEPCDPPRDPSVLEFLARKMALFQPRLSKLGVRHYWAGLRTFSPDKEFVVRRDSQLENFYWVAALAGHGVTCSPAVGELAAAQILEPLSADAGPLEVGAEGSLSQ